ncbi:MAG: prephenate dehydratase [Glaciecola sp.]|jgi:prephenate dehydratase
MTSNPRTANAALQGVTYLGPQGTFSEQAAMLVAIGDEPMIPCGDVFEAVRLVENGSASRAVLPIENTLEGSVAATLDLLAFDTDLTVQGELELQVELVLAVRPGVALAEITEVRSHPIPLAGCRRWLAATIPGAVRSSAASTAKAAAQIAASDEPWAAIVNPLAAERFGLQVVATEIADHAGNATRFVVVSPGMQPATGWDKTSLVVYIEANQPGALLAMLELFAERDLQLTKIESRPTKDELGEYCFFLDVEGHLSDEIVGDALAALHRTQREVKILGSYPRSGRPVLATTQRITRDNAAHREALTWLATQRNRLD